MSDEHTATAREVTRDWTPQTTLADSRRDIANALAAAEERGRRAGTEEAADKAYTAAHEAAEEIWKLHGAMQEAPCYQAAIAALRTIRKIELALAPRDSGKVPGSINVAELFDPAGDEE